MSKPTDRQNPLSSLDGASMMAMQILNGGPRDRLGTASLLANDVTRIATGVANAFTHTIVHQKHYDDLHTVINGLRERLTLLEKVARIVEMQERRETPPEGT